jgi:hypothetical protein
MFFRTELIFTGFIRRTDMLGNLCSEEWGGVELWCLMPIQQYFSYIVAVSFIDEGNQRKPLTCRKSPVDKLYHKNVFVCTNILL